MRPRDVGKGQDSLWAWHAETVHDPAVNYFAMSSAANYTPAAVLTSPTPQRSRASVAALDRPHSGLSRPRDANKLQDRLWVQCAETDRDPAASYFAIHGVAN